MTSKQKNNFDIISQFMNSDMKEKNQKKQFLKYVSQIDKYMKETLILDSFMRTERSLIERGERNTQNMAVRQFLYC